MSRKQTQADLLAKIPPSATRVRVTTDKGEVKFKAIDDVTRTDQIMTNKMGDPVVMKGTPGRKATVVLGPVTPTVGALLQRKQVAMDGDPVLVKTKKDPDSADVLHEVIIGLSEEAASLKFERDEAARQGQDSSSMSAKRIQALRAVGETWLKRKDQIAAKVIDLDSPSFMSVFKFMTDTMREAMASAKLRPEQVETVFARFASMVTEEWKVEAKTRMKNAQGN